MKAKEIRDLSYDELIKKEGELKAELFNLRFRLATGQLDNPMTIKAVKKDMAISTYPPESPDIIPSAVPSAVAIIMPLKDISTVSRIAYSSLTATSRPRLSVPIRYGDNGSKKDGFISRLVRSVSARSTGAITGARSPAPTMIKKVMIKNRIIGGTPLLPFRLLFLCIILPLPSAFPYPWIQQSIGQIHQQVHKGH